MCGLESSVNLLVPLVFPKMEGVATENSSRFRHDVIRFRSEAFFNPSRPPCMAIQDLGEETKSLADLKHADASWRGEISN